MYKYGNAILYSVLTGCRIIILLISLNSFQSSSRTKLKNKIKYLTVVSDMIKVNAYAGFESLMSGSNFGPPGIAMFKALAVKNDFGSNK